MELEKAIKYLKDIKQKDEKYLEEYDIKDKDMFRNDIEAISAVLQALEELQQKEKSRIIGNINEIKIEDLEPILKPYYIPKEKVENEIKELDNMQVDGEVFTTAVNFAKKTLQELLEE